ncbi:MAG: 3-oxoacyl-ACP reductase FabG [Gammaproteobacteria bacterium]|nr:3-oxoacyl-ACP reductase FabG [Gammaproteobacteria bacterium]
MTTKHLALVTGASRGIGQAIAQQLINDGFELVGTATSQSGVDAIEAAFGASGALRAGLVLDVLDRNSIDAFFAHMDERGLSPAILVNNAGITRDNLLLRMKDDEWDAVIAANLSAVFSLSRRCVRTMLKARFGRIINITSVIGAAGNAGQANYAAAKAGVVGFTKSMALEVASRNITVNAVAPGLIDTDMTRKLTEQQRDAALGQVPMGRMGAAEEVAAVVAFLASPLAGYITGETIHVNGGMYMA